MIRTTLLALTCLLAVTAAHSQVEETDIDSTYFHPAASMYIHGNAAGASNLVARGLALFPEDGKLRRLKELLDQQQEQENQDQQQNQDQEQEQEDQDQDQQQDQDQDQDQQQQNEEQQQDDQQEQESEQQDQPPETQPAEPPRAEEMTQDEAEQLLDAMRQEEQNKRLQLHPVLGAPVQVDKDW